MLSNYIKEKRREFDFTQEDLAAKAGVGLRFIREKEHGNTTLRMDKVNQVLALFDTQLEFKKFAAKNKQVAFYIESSFLNEELKDVYKKIWIEKQEIFQR